MARMIPCDLRFEKSDAERSVFAALHEALPDDYTVLHHVAWVQRRDRNRGAVDGETDFVIIHPERGVLIVEVKGGAIKYDASEGAWYTKARDGEWSRLKRPPIDQVKDAHYGLRAWLSKLPNWSPEWRNAFGHAVCFPDVVFDALPLPELEPRLVFDADTVRTPGQLRESIDAALALWTDTRRPLGQEGAEVIIESLAHDVVLRQPLGFVVSETDRQLLDLSERQYDVLRLLARERRVAISGPAGSGKTLIAAEKARRLAADEGVRTLLTCYNRPLADYLRASLAHVPRLEVCGYHQLAGILARKCGMRTPRGGWPQSNEWDEWSRVLDDAASRLGPQYDAIVVDEGQDFAESWWPPLARLLDSDGGTLYVFYDDNQTLYRRPRGLPQGMMDVALTENFRNARPIFETVMRFYKGEPVVCRGPGGPPVETRSVPSAQLRRELGATLQRLIAEGELSSSEVVVLTAHGLDRSRIRGRVGDFNLTPEPEREGDVQLSTIHRFKGLDSPAVVLCEIDRRQRREQDELLYVGCSRARVLLTVLLTE